MFRTPPSIPKEKIDQAERKIGAILEDLEESTSTEVKDVDLEKIVDDDPVTGRPTIHDGVDIEVEAKPQRKWRK